MSDVNGVNLDYLPEDWGFLPNTTGICPPSLEELLKYLLEEAFQKGGMDQAHEVLDMIGNCLE